MVTLILHLTYGWIFSLLLHKKVLLRLDNVCQSIFLKLNCNFICLRIERKALKSTKSNELHKATNAGIIPLEITGV